MRPLAQVLRQESPLSLAREVFWRAQKGRERRRFLKQVALAHCPVSFRNIPYYSESSPSLDDRSRELICSFADDVCAGRFPFLGYGTVPLGTQPDWYMDFVNGHRFPRVSIENRDILRFDGSDVKAPYELSRLQFLPVLGKAHVLTRDERYRRAARELLSHWMDENPAGHGVNWSLAMEAALRAMSICFLLNLLAPIRADEQEWFSGVTRSLWDHYLFIQAHNEFSHLIRSNHYLSNIVGLYCLSSFLEGHGMSSKRRRYRRRVEAELFQQVYEDGGDFESSTGYQVLVAQMFTSVHLINQANGFTPNPRFVERLRRMHALMRRLASRCGQIPQVGDCDDGRVEFFVDDLEQMQSLPVEQRNSLRVANFLGLGAFLFEKETAGMNGLSTSSATEDAKWFGFHPHENEPTASHSAFSGTPSTTTVFRQSGIAVANREGADLLFFALPNGIKGKGSHTHNDKLSVVLRVNDQDVFADPGTGCYTRDASVRNRFRVTEVHNTVMVDGKEQNAIDLKPHFVFCTGNDAAVSAIVQSSAGGDVTLRASHSGYQSLGVTHERTIRFPEGRNVAVIEDVLSGDGAHQASVRFQLAPGWNASPFEQTGQDFHCRLSGPGLVSMRFSGPESFEAEQVESAVSMTYGVTTPSSALQFSGRVALPTRFTTEVGWCANSANGGGGC